MREQAAAASAAIGGDRDAHRVGCRVVRPIGLDRGRDGAGAGGDERQRRPVDRADEAIGGVVRHETGAIGGDAQGGGAIGERDGVWGRLVVDLREQRLREQAAAASAAGCSNGEGELRGNGREVVRITILSDLNLALAVGIETDRVTSSGANVRRQRGVRERQPRR